MIKNIVLIILIILTGFSVGYAQNSFSDTLSYEIVHRNIVIKVKVNGKEARFIYDTGGIPWIIASEATRLGISNSGFKSTSDMNQKTAWQQNGIIEDLQISPHYSKKQVETVISADILMFKNAGLAGLLNNAVFGQVVVSILPREKKIVLTPYRPKGVDKTQGIAVKILPNNAFVLPLQFGNATSEAMFDTGFDRFLGIDNEVLKQLKEMAGIRELDRYHGISAIGISGLPEPDTFYKLQIPTVQLGRKVFSNVSSITHKSSNNILGIELLKYGNVILDIPRQMFYFQPFDQGTVDFGRATKDWNVKLLPMPDGFMIGGIWGQSAAMKFGDRVTHINGKSLEGFPKDQYEIEQFMDKIVEDTATITLKKEAGKAQNVTISKR